MENGWKMEDGKWKPETGNRFHHPSMLLGSRGEVRQVAVPRRPFVQRFRQADIWPVWLSVVQLPWFSFRIARHPGLSRSSTRSEVDASLHGMSPPETCLQQGQRLHCDSYAGFRWRYA